ncbi:hypothetical protein BGX34_003545 [Mortierella sp. NVP85]|nr:hypothetical protein BGX34_003545 [Mortierella sp. NVP85]
MGNSVSSMSKKTPSSLEVPPSEGKKASFFQRSKSSLHFRSRSKSSASLTDSIRSIEKLSSTVSNLHSHRHHRDSTDSHSDYSLQSGESNHSDPKTKPIHQVLKDSATTNSTTSTGDASLPEWAYQIRQCDDGRTRHTVDSAPYMLPNDLTESDRLDAQHYLVRFVFKGNYNVPLDPHAHLKILDVATGTGVWALEMAHEFPKAQVYGVDISAIFPATIKPSNCHFQLCNILDGLPFPDNYFDFIYQRLLVYALTPAQRKQVNAELLRVLKPEGYLQLVESDGLVYNAGPEMEKINQLSLETSLRHGVDPREVQTMKAGLKLAGYSGVNSFNMALPVGDWGGKAGALSRQNMHGLATIWLKGEVGKLDQPAVDAVLAIADKESEEFKSYYKVWLVVGQKPSAAVMQAREAKKAALAAGSSNRGPLTPPASPAADTASQRCMTTA